MLQLCLPQLFRRPTRFLRNYAATTIAARVILFALTEGPHRFSLIQYGGTFVSDTPSLYERLGGYDAISAVAGNLLPRLTNDEQLGRFWAYRGTDGIEREKQLLIDFLCHNTGGPMYYTGRSMTASHRGMNISEGDWSRFISHLNNTLDHFELPAAERQEVLDFIESTKSEIVET